jgi:diphosphomevalonate decarboxylase
VFRSQRDVIATAVAHANIALAKYWGKSDVEQNLPAVPSLSLTLDRLRTITRVELDKSLARDEIVLDGVELDGRPRERVVALLDRVRATAANASFARVTSRNEIPTAAGLASSASGFAALGLAATRAFGLSLSAGEVSALARRSSASAARSLFGGFVALEKAAQCAEPIAPASALPVSMVVVMTAKGPKPVGSTEGMLHTAATSPYYAAWLEAAPRLYEDMKRAVLAGDLVALGPLVEQSALAMHASMWAARPAIVYFTPTTVAVMERVRALRGDGALAFYTMDAGPHVKVLTLTRDADALAAELARVPGVQSTLVAGPGPDARIDDGVMP